MQVERRQRISSDLVAALQFEERSASAVGSPRLRQAVIEGGFRAHRRLNVHDGFDSGPTVRRVAWLILAVAGAATFIGVFPEYARVFGQRLALGATHYPSWTQIRTIGVSGMPVLENAEHPTPRDVRLAEGLPLEFLVRVTGRLPERGEARLVSGPSDARRVLELEPLSLDERRLRLEDAQARIQAAQEDPQIDVVGPWADEVAALLRYDCSDAAAEIAAIVSGNSDASLSDRERLTLATEPLNDRLAAWPDEAESAAVFRARLDRLVEPVSYQIYLGDAWTDSARVEIIPAPALELQLTATPPAYAKAAPTTARDSGSRQVSALEGSRIDVAANCTNNKRLQRVWLTLKDETEPLRLELKPVDDEQQQWRLDVSGTPLERIERPLRFELQVTDEDGLHLPSPARAYIGIKPDRPPTGSAEIVHRVVLPTARPTIIYRVADDYGVANVRLKMQIEKARESDGYRAEDSDAEPTTASASPADSNVESSSAATSAEATAPSEATTSTESSHVDLLAGGPLVAEQLPRRGEAPIDLGSLGLVKGDRLKLTLEVTDYRGESPGVTILADPLILEISDESGVLAAISEADERSEERMTEIIKQQLGIGDSP
ncbi:MAG: hypothetical protein R3C99_13560 [Pirellulaceae bacterium]